VARIDEAVTFARHNQTLAAIGVAAALVTAYLTWRMLRGPSSPPPTSTTDPSLAAADPTAPSSGLAAESGIPTFGDTATGGFGLSDPATYAAEIATALVSLGVGSSGSASLAPPTATIPAPTDTVPAPSPAPGTHYGVHEPIASAPPTGFLRPPVGGTLERFPTLTNAPTAATPATRPAGQSTGGVRPTGIGTVPNIHRGTPPRIATPVGHVAPHKAPTLKKPAPRPKIVHPPVRSAHAIARNL